MLLDSHFHPVLYLLSYGVHQPERAYFQGNYLVMNLDSEIKFQNFITESVVADVNDRPSKNPKNISGKLHQILI
jgi:hypothetical protein